MPSTVAEIMDIIQSSSVRLIRLLYCDTSAIIRGKTSSSHSLKERLESGVGLVKGMMAFNLLDEMQADTGYGAAGEFRLVPDLSTFVVLPYVPQSAAVICDLKELDGKASGLCPRNVLARQLDEAGKLGITFQAAFEPEFMLGWENEGSFKPVDRAGCFTTEAMNSAWQFIINFADALDRQGLQVEQYYPEYGHGQHELSIKHSPALIACDHHIWYRETLRAVAFNAGLTASLAPKPFANQAGNGCHLHLSAWNAGSVQNLFFGGKELSEFGRQFVAGILDHLPALVALTCPTVNSYRRLKPRSWSSAFVCWGYENREAAVRVPSTYWGQEENGTNLELKCVDASCNPYLALAAVIACGLDGVTRKLSPPEPLSQDPGTMTEDELKCSALSRLPADLAGALRFLERDELLMSVLGPELARTYLTVKRSEHLAFSLKDLDFELAQHRTKF